MTEPKTVHVLTPEALALIHELTGQLDQARRIKEMVSEAYVHIIEKLTRERDQARRIAAILEAECADCWGPVHSQAIAEVRLSTLLLDLEAADDGAR